MSVMQAYPAKQRASHATMTLKTAVDVEQEDWETGEEEEKGEMLKYGHYSHHPV